MFQLKSNFFIVDGFRASVRLMRDGNYRLNEAITITQTYILGTHYLTYFITYSVKLMIRDIQNQLEVNSFNKSFFLSLKELFK